MKHILYILFLLNGLFMSAQTSYDGLIENKALINTEKETVLLPSGEYWSSQSFNKLIAILSNDIFTYYDLNETYSTPLKKKTFQESDEYLNKLLPEFNEVKKKVSSAQFYTLFNLRYNESYNIDTNSFKFRIGVNDYSTTTTPGYIGLGHNFCVSFPANRVNVKKNRTNYGDYFLQQYITTSTVSQETALKIENAMEDPYCSVCLLFVVKPIKVSNEKITMNFGGYVGTQGIVNQNILAKTIGLYIVDTKTNEILCDLSSILKTTNNSSSKNKRR